jgi:uncharacterized membrane protein YoaK (UPF0700 family)
MRVTRDHTGMTKNAGEQAAADGRWHGAVRDSRVVLATVTTGAVNAVTFLFLGKVFSSVITGNLVLLGVSAVDHSSSEAIHGGVAIASYAAGVAVGAPLAARGNDHGSTWPGSVTTTLAAELCVLAAFCLGWELADGRPRGGAQLVLLVLVAAAMGMQSAAIRRLGQMSSTFLTNTLTGVVAGLVTRTMPDGIGRSLGVIAAMVVGALAAGFLATEAYAWLPVMILLPLGLVIVASVASVRSGKRRRRAGED